jgi:sulfatase modifying factor 1
MRKTTIILSTFFCVSIALLSFKSNLPFSMVKVEGGNFFMGSDDSDGSADIDEQKKHEVFVNSFEISKFEVTVWEWKQFVKAKKIKMPKEPKWGWKDKLPINNITWEEAISYCNWLSKKEGLTQVYTKTGPFYYCNFSANGYRLPTEAEWEYAAKGGKLSKGYKYSGSNTLDDVAWHKANSQGMPHIVGSKLQNELGLHDMSGNVWEWCWDWYNKDYYKIENNNNPKGPENGEKKSVRGGSWDSQPNYSRPANRISTKLEKTHEFYGFRIAKSIIQ